MANDAKKRIKSLLARLKAAPAKKEISEDTDHYKTVAALPDGEKVFITTSISQNPQILKPLANEAYILKKITDELNGGAKISFPKLIKSRVNKKSVWHVRAFLEGKPFGTWQEGFSEEVLANTQIAKNLAQGIYYLQVNLQRTADERKLPSRKLDQIKKDAKLLAAKLKAAGLLDEKTVARVGAIADKTNPRETMVFCHNYVTPENLLIENKSNNPALVNWKYACISTPALDLASVWTYAVCSTEWQKAFLEAYLELSSNQLIVKEYLDLEKAHQILRLLNKFKDESNIKTIKNGKKKFLDALLKTLASL